MMIVRGPSRGLLGKSLAAWQKSRKESDNESDQIRISNRKAARVFFDVVRQDGTKKGVYLQITSLVYVDNKVVEFVAIDPNGRKVKGQFEPPASAAERLSYNPNTRKVIGELEYI